ncbi:biotin-dependent carboxyltransferase family protein [Desulfoluna sp.]|uniref:5-oxoprolinase subunit C family protein n=1 Tax=Desulfoluna sp. TaxID=2045199 RepID=UPI00262A379B|nr:biotin-dependent carboxyltransferase family protein [Desulfoluna sp.]
MTPSVAVFNVREPGPLTTVQDLGRYGYQRFGVPPSGALDTRAAVLANLLVGNPDGAAVLEMTYYGATLEILSSCTLALAGATMDVTVNGAPISCWRSFSVSAGDVVAIGMATSGCRGYLALGGGIDVPEVMGSRSCYVGGKFGGHKGRALAHGDVIYGVSPGAGSPPKSIPESFRPVYASSIELRAVAGPQDDFFDEGLALFFSREFTITQQANRMGYRLEGPKVLRKEGMPKSIISEPSLPGGVQVPEGGDPIILLREQTVGGYAKIASVISDDISRVAQALPGQTIRFQRVSVAAAHQITVEHHQRLLTLKDMDLALA